MCMQTKFSSWIKTFFWGWAINIMKILISWAWYDHHERWTLIFIAFESFYQMTYQKGIIVQVQNTKDVWPSFVCCICTFCIVVEKRGFQWCDEDTRVLWEKRLKNHCRFITLMFPFYFRIPCKRAKFFSFLSFDACSFENSFQHKEE